MMKKDIAICSNPECKKEFEEVQTNNYIKCPHCQKIMFPSTREPIKPQKNDKTTS